MATSNAARAGVSGRRSSRPARTTQRAPSRDGEVSPRMALLGFMSGQITIADDFDETPDELIALMTDGPI